MNLNPGIEVDGKNERSPFLDEDPNGNDVAFDGYLSCFQGWSGSMRAAT